MTKFYMIIMVILIISCKTETHKDTESIISSKPVKVELIQTEGKYQLLVDKKPFYIKGAGLEFGDIKSLAEHHGNSFRTWRTENGKQTGKEVLDEAHKYGLKVTMGIEVARERHGFNYNDEAAVKKQLETIKQEVLALKNHPALIIWAIGNELNLRSTNPKVWDAVNDISKMIHEVDPNHLTTTTLAGISQQEINYIKDRCPDLDLLSLQMYGKIIELPKLVKEYGWKGPYMVTEWGATGHWEVPKTEWGVPIEENSTVKAANYLKRYKGAIEADTLQCVGSYVFLWSQKQERTPTWYGIFLEDGKETEAVEVMHYVWSGAWPEVRTPQIKSFTVDNKISNDNVVLNANQECLASLKIIDAEKYQLNYKWEILFESTNLSDGGDFEKKPNAVDIIITNNNEGELKFKAPKDKGFYRLFVYVDDGNDHSATANIPFKVI